MPSVRAAALQWVVVVTLVFSGVIMVDYMIMTDLEQEKLFSNANRASQHFINQDNNAIMHNESESIDSCAIRMDFATHFRDKTLRGWRRSRPAMRLCGPPQLPFLLPIVNRKCANKKDGGKCKIQCQEGFKAVNPYLICVEGERWEPRDPTQGHSRCIPETAEARERVNTANATDWCTNSRFARMSETQQQQFLDSGHVLPLANYNKRLAKVERLRMKSKKRRITKDGEEEMNSSVKKLYMIDADGFQSNVAYGTGHDVFGFVHIPKTGGESIDEALALRKNHLFGRYRVYHEPEWECPSFVTFSVVRNPWSHMVSWYFFCRHRDLPPGVAKRMRKEGSSRGTRPKGGCAYARDHDFPSWLRWVLEPEQREPVEARGEVMDMWLWAPYTDYILDENDQPLVRYVARFEDYERDLSCVARLGGLQRLVLPHKNTSRKNVTHWRDMYNDETRELVAAAYADDISLFDYSFDGS